MTGVNPRPVSGDRYKIAGIEDDPKDGIKVYSSKKGRLFAIFAASFQKEESWLSRSSAQRYINFQVDKGTLEGRGLKKIKWYSSKKTYMKYLNALKEIGQERLASKRMSPPAFRAADPVEPSFPGGLATGSGEGSAPPPKTPTPAAPLAAPPAKPSGLNVVIEGGGQEAKSDQEKTDQQFFGLGMDAVRSLGSKPVNTRTGQLAIECFELSAGKFALDPHSIPRDLKDIESRLKRGDFGGVTPRSFKNRHIGAQFELAKLYIKQSNQLEKEKMPNQSSLLRALFYLLCVEQNRDRSPGTLAVKAEARALLLGLLEKNNAGSSLVIDEPALSQHEVAEIRQEIEAAKAPQGTYTAIQKEYWRSFVNPADGQPAIDAEGSVTVLSQRFEELKGSTRNMSRKPTMAYWMGNADFVAVDPAKSFRLNRHYETLLKKITDYQQHLRRSGKQLSEELTILILQEYVYREVFFNSDCVDPGTTKSKLNAFVAKKLEEPGTERIRFIEPGIYGPDGKVYPVIPIDDHIEAGLGVCVHMSVVTAYFLDKLSKEEPPIMAGVVQFMRDNVFGSDGSGGGHVWVTFATAKGDLWHLDPRSLIQEKLIKEFNIQQNVYDKLKKRYGHTQKESPIDNEISRAFSALKEVRELQRRK